MHVKVAIIGGTGIGSRLSKAGGKKVRIPTRFGLCSGLITSDELLLVSRHAGGHRVPPHMVNYRAQAEGLRQIGVEYCFASAAVGSLRADWLPGKLIVCSDFLEITNRNETRFEDEVVHQGFSNPFDKVATNALLLASKGDAETSGTYVCANGPRYETPAEIHMFREWGGDVVGMTAGTEAIAMKEAGIGYGLLAIVTNLGAGLSEIEPNHQEVVDQMELSGALAVQILKEAAKQIVQRKDSK